MWTGSSSAERTLTCRPGPDPRQSRQTDRVAARLKLLPSPGQLNLKSKQLDRSLDPISRAPFTKQGQFPAFLFELSYWPSEKCDARDLFQDFGPPPLPPNHLHRYIIRVKSDNVVLEWEQKVQQRKTRIDQVFLKFWYDDFVCVINWRTLFVYQTNQITNLLPFLGLKESIWKYFPKCTVKQIQNEI